MNHSANLSVPLYRCMYLVEFKVIWYNEHGRDLQF